MKPGGNRDITDSSAEESMTDIYGYAVALHYTTGGPPLMYRQNLVLEADLLGANNSLCLFRMGMLDFNAKY